MISTFNPLKDVHIQSIEVEYQLVEKLSRKKTVDRTKKITFPGYAVSKYHWLH